MDKLEELFEEFKEELSRSKSYSEFTRKDGAYKKLIKFALEHMLDAELSEHLGYEKHSSKGIGTGNSRNGKSHKTIIDDSGEINLEIPRDRNSSFDPVVIKKYEKTLGPIEDKIISMYAKGMTTRDIQSHVSDIYGIDISATTISNMTDKIVESAKIWQNRPLESLYPIVFFDAIHFKVKQDGRIISKAAYTCLGISAEGMKDMLGIWIDQAEGAAFWLNILSELKSRGVEDILIAAVDGLKGFPEAINAVFPDCRIQLCVIHQIRNSMKFLPDKQRREFVKDIRKVYGAVNENQALDQLSIVEEKYAQKYPLAVTSWRRNWENLSAFFDFPPEIRKLIYTTNAVEALHRQFRKVTKARTIFPNDEALFKNIYLAFKDISKKWGMPIRYWPLIISQLSIKFPDKIRGFL